MNLSSRHVEGPAGLWEGRGVLDRTSCVEKEQGNSKAESRSRVETEGGYEGRSE